MQPNARIPFEAGHGAPSRSISRRLERRQLPYRPRHGSGRSMSSTRLLARRQGVPGARAAAEIGPVAAMASGKASCRTDSEQVALAGTSAKLDVHDARG